METRYSKEGSHFLLIFGQLLHQNLHDWSKIPEMKQVLGFVIDDLDNPNMTSLVLKGATFFGINILTIHKASKSALENVQRFKYYFRGYSYLEIFCIFL